MEPTAKQTAEAQSIQDAKVALLEALGEVGVVAPVRVRAVSGAVAAYVAAHIRVERSESRREAAAAYERGFKAGAATEAGKKSVFEQMFGPSVHR